MNNYVVKPEDLTGDIKGFPIELVQWMVDQQVKQGNKADVGVFQRYKGRSKHSGGFDWDKTELGHDVCNEIIDNKNFDLFFKHFPKHFGLPELKAVEMDVSDNGVHWYKEYVVGVYNNKYLTRVGNSWTYARPIQQPVKLTRAEIAEKFGVSKDFIIED